MTDLRSITQLLLRLTLGVVFFAHGWEKLVIKGIDKTAILFGDGPGGKNGFEIPSRPPPPISLRGPRCSAAPR